MSLNEKKDLKLRLFLRSVYVKGHQDGNLKTSDLSWEDKIVKDIDKLYEKNYLKGVEDGKEIVRKGLPTVEELWKILLDIWKPNKEYYDAADLHDLAQAIHARLKNNLLKKES